MSLPSLRALWLLALALLPGAIPAHACSVPVFRYALEHWDAAPFRAFVFHRGPLSDAQQAGVRELGKDGLAGKLHANISVRTVDLDQNPPPELLELWQQAHTGTLPLLVAQFPESNRATASFWSGPLTTESAAQLLDSPARGEIVRRLGEGQSAVWLLLESGDAAKDSAATALLDARLQHLASILQLPKLDAQDIANGLVSTGQEGMRLEFSTLRIPRDDPREQPFIRMMLGSEADLADAKGPIVIPVFGQGRALYALVGGGIKQETIDKAATFLIGKCSCEVKEQNPGFDLLLAADWRALIAAQNAGIPDLPTIAELTKSAPVTVTISAGSPPAESGATAGSETMPPRPKTVPIPQVLGVGAALLFASLLILALWRRK
ncbi:MAG: hypothetical protein ABI318_11060 [Chthoniobacteraceae bacterium]